MVDAFNDTDGACGELLDSSGKGSGRCRNLLDSIKVPSSSRKTSFIDGQMHVPASSVEDPCYSYEFLNMLKAELNPFSGSLGVLVSIDPKYFRTRDGGNKFNEFLSILCADPWFRDNAVVVSCCTGDRCGKLNVGLLRERNLLESGNYKRKALGTKNATIYTIPEYEALFCMGIYATCDKAMETIEEDK